MARDEERLQRITQALRAEGLDALLATLAKDLLLLSGYWPVLGTSLALVTRDGAVIVLAPEDERELAEQGGADEVCTFEPASLKEMTTADQAVRGPLAEIVRRRKLGRARVGYSGGPATEPSTYAAMYLFGIGIVPVLEASWPGATAVPADEVLARLRSVMTPHEVNQVRKACRIAERAFEQGSRQLRAGLKETEAALGFRAPLSAFGVGFEGTSRAGGFTFCMSGPNSARAHGAYARSRARVLEKSDLVLTHCNSYADGFWTDITRTYSLSPPDERVVRMYEAVDEARAAALAAIRPGVRAAEIDRAARDVLTARGFGGDFKHSTGHGVGFAAISHNARPQLHPKSNEVLETGMVFNVEPAIYIDGVGGMRHCDMVAVGSHGADVLTPFQSSWKDLVLSGDR